MLDHVWETAAEGNFVELHEPGRPGDFAFQDRWYNSLCSKTYVTVIPCD
jgi:hypothetical protein